MKNGVFSGVNPCGGELVSVPREVETAHGCLKALWTVATTQEEVAFLVAVLGLVCGVIKEILFVPSVASGRTG